MSSLKTNGEDLVHSYAGNTDYLGNTDGLTKREYFAALAMQGLLATGKTLHIDGILIGVESMALNIADSLIEELNR